MHRNDLTLLDLKPLLPPTWLVATQTEASPKKNMGKKTKRNTSTSIS